MHFGRNYWNNTENNRQTVPKMLHVVKVQFVKHTLKKSVDQTAVL